MSGPYLVTILATVCKHIGCSKQASRSLWRKPGDHEGDYCRVHGKEALLRLTAELDDR